MENKEKILGSFIAQLVVKLRENQRAIEEFLDELGDVTGGIEKAVIEKIGNAKSSEAIDLWKQSFTYAMAAKMVDYPDRHFTDVAYLVNSHAKSRPDEEGHSVVSNAIWALANQIGPDNRAVMMLLCSNLNALNEE